MRRADVLEEVLLDGFDEEGIGRRTGGSGVDFRPAGRCAGVVLEAIHLAIGVNVAVMCGGLGEASGITRSWFNT